MLLQLKWSTVHTSQHAMPKSNGAKQMYANQYEEHLAHSASCNSRWDGFDRGDLDAVDCAADQGERVIGRMTNEAGKRVVIVEQYCDDFRNYQVHIDGKCVFDNSEDRTRAITVARWWMAGCPA